jgi:hypothetical protein
LIQNAFYTEPKDSSAWFYYRWLVGQYILNFSVFFLIFFLIPLLEQLPKESQQQILQKELVRLTEFQTFLAESETGPDALMMQKCKTLD